MLRTDIKETLTGFYSRMKFINIVRNIVITSCTDDVRSMFKDNPGIYDMLTELTFAVLLRIKDLTLSNNKPCTVQNIADYIDDLKHILLPGCVIDSTKLATYIIITVLQNNGKLIEYSVFDEETETKKKMYIRIIYEEKGSYYLTDDIFDFLFRTKEIEAELGYSLQRFIMQEYMKRKNYSEAYEQSRELIAELRNLKLSFNEFNRRCRKNVLKIEATEFKEIMQRFYDLIKDEQSKIEDIQKTAKKEIESLKAALETGLDDEKVQKNLKALEAICQNLEIVIQEQRALSNDRHDIADDYVKMLESSFAIRNYERMDIEKDILAKMECDMGDKLGDFFCEFFLPLIKPELPKIFSIENFYVSMDDLNVIEEEKGLNIESEGSIIDQINEKRNTIYSEIVTSFFGFIQNETSFELKKYLKSLTMGEILKWSEENLLPSTLLKLWSMQEIDIDDCKSEMKQGIIPPLGKLNLLWIFQNMPQEYLNIKKVKFKDSNETYKLFVKDEAKEITIEITDYIVEVER